MQKLSSESHVNLTENVLKKLAQNRITTILEFLHEDYEKLSTLTKLSLPQILDIKNYIFSKYSAPLIKGTVLLNKISGKQYLCTGIKCLDDVLNGGIPIGFITEMCGLTDSGKTQLCLQLTINCVKHYPNSVLYVNTKGDFSAVRVQKILDASGFSHKDMAKMMHQIHIVHIWTMEELIELLKILKNKMFSIDNLVLIIIDSLPCLMLQHLGDSNRIGLTYLNTVVNYSRYLCDTFQIAIVCVNLQTRWVEQDFNELEDEGEQSTLVKDSACVEKRNRCLGKYWQHIPVTVFTLEKYQINQEDNAPELKITVIKADNLESGRNCLLKLNYLGIT